MKRTLIPLLLGLLVLTACGPRQPATLTVMTHDSFAASEEVIQRV